MAVVSACTKSAVVTRVIEAMIVASTRMRRHNARSSRVDTAYAWMLRKRVSPEPEDANEWL